MANETEAYASPACLLGEVADAYAGYWTAEEGSEFLGALLAREAATAELLRGALPRIRDDALHAALKAMLEAHERSEAACATLAHAMKEVPG